MRLLVAFLYSFYILSLACAPCSDGGQCEKEMHNNEISHTHESNSNEKNKTEDCSPLCSCACCGLPIVVSHVNYNISIPIYSGKQNNPFFKTEVLPEVYFNIWQPPKIV